MNRRDLLRAGFYAGAGWLSKPSSFARSAWSLALPQAAAGSVQTGSNVAGAKSLALASYVDPLPIPPVIRANQKIVEVRMQEFLHKAHRDLPPTRLWGYNGIWPGPTFEVRQNQPLHVNWINKLPTKHFLPIDTTIHGSEANVPSVRTIVHVHGAQVLPNDDGYPDAWITADGKTGKAYTSGPNHYPNAQQARTLWYHDHALGITRLNVYAGLAGLYIIRDEQEESLNLPNGAYDIPLLIQDRQFLADGSLLYPAAQNGTHPVWIQEYFGDAICVNGKAMPFLEVEARKYRFRMVNGSNSRFYHLALLPADEAGKPNGRPADAPPFHQIGTDGGLLPAPVSLHYLVFSPGERFDLVIDFTDFKGGNFALVNDAPAPYTRGGEIVPTDVMLFKVTRPLAGKDTSSLPDTLVPFQELNPAEAVTERMLAITEMDRPSDGYTMMGMLGGKHWDDPITENPKAGSMEIWSFVNATGDVHPMHIHQVQFQVLNRQAFDVKNYQQTGQIIFTGSPRPPERNERPAWKDTIKTYPGFITRVVQRFDLPPGTKATPRQEFRYVWHCHILEHEDNEMMRPYNIVG